MAPKCAASAHPEVKADVSAAAKAAVSVVNVVVNAAQQTLLPAMPRAPKLK